MPAHRASVFCCRLQTPEPKTPPDDAEALKAGSSPKLHALDTSVQVQVQASRGLCESGAEGTKALGELGEHESATAQLRGRKMSPTRTITRTSSKRSATQLPSPSSPTCELPPKMARYRLSYNEPGMDMDTDTDEDVTHVVVKDGDISEKDEDEDEWVGGLGGHSQSTSAPLTPDFALPMSALCLPDAEDEGIDVEDLALSPPHSRNASLDCAHLSTMALQRDWAVFKQASALLESHIIYLEHMGAPLQHARLLPPPPPPPQPPRQPSTGCTPKATFLTLPPELRHQIYRLDTDLVKPYPLCYCLENAGSKLQHPFASVSRQIRHEALSIFYSHNVWTIKVEYNMFYEAFRDWIIRLGPEGAGLLRLVTLSVRGVLFKPVRSVHAQSVVVNGQATAMGVLPSPSPTAAAAMRYDEFYSPPDGEASFSIDLSEKFPGGRVRLIRNDGGVEAGEVGRRKLEGLVGEVWAKRRDGRLEGQDWIGLVDGFLAFVGMVGGKW
ncbi:hypothetical protein B5807_09310 [Epicoccum nigrum]|uniref:F-box domain-containing protein n=1 Tax=Epicoccum nigrum TaxID=105696 RepID=A0A1Y2LNN4_EPING|nr:hypothetical protein B5807_09310 [Epicoccum nigrum]